MREKKHPVTSPVDPFLEAHYTIHLLGSMSYIKFNHSSCLRDAQYTYITIKLSVQSLYYWLYITIVGNLANKSTLTLIKLVAVCPLKAGLRFLMFTKAFWT